MKESTFWKEIDWIREAYDEDFECAKKENREFEGWHTSLILQGGLVLETNQPYEIEQNSNTDDCGIFVCASRITLNGVELPAGVACFDIMDVIAIIA